MEATKIIYRSSRHLEISNLIVTGLTDVVEEVRLLARWVKNELSDRVPVHFVRFHPAYKYTVVPRTPIEFLEEAKKIALEEGLRHVYIGNTYQNGHADTLCKDCGALLIQRFGLFTRFLEITQYGTCGVCGKKQGIELQPVKNSPEIIADDMAMNENAVWEWSNLNARNLHLQIQNNSANDDFLVCEHINENNELIDSRVMNIPGNVKLRYAVGQIVDTEKEVRIKHNGSITCQIVELLDRAHFPLATGAY